MSACRIDDAQAHHAARSRNASKIPQLLRRPAALRVFSTFLVFAFLAALLQANPCSAAAPAHAGAQDMFEIRDVLDQIAHREREKGRIDCSHVAAASEHAGNVPRREEALVRAFGVLRDALARLQRHPTECSAIEIAAHQVARMQTHLDGFLEEMEAAAGNMTGALDQMDRELDRVKRQLDEGENTKIIQLSAEASASEDTVVLRNLLQGYSTALAMCMLAKEDYADAWRPFGRAVERLHGRVGAWKRDGGCDASDDLSVVFQVLFQGHAVMGEGSG